MKIFGYFKFKEGLNLSSDCLSKEYNIQISNFKGKILTPFLIKNFEIDSNNIRIDLLPPKSKLDCLDKRLNWGRPYSWPNGDSSVQTLKIEININEQNFSIKSKNELEKAIESWINLFRLNLFAFNYNIDSPDLIEKTSTNEIFEFFFLTETENIQDKFFKGTIPSVTIYVSETIKEADFKNVLDVTSLNKKLILEYQLLRDANKELLLENYKKSILDSATALEVSLTNAIKRDLEIDEKLLLPILKKYNGLRQKRDLLKLTKNKLPLKDKIYEVGIEKLRNEAIHSGKTPSKREAMNAFDIAKKTIDSLITEKFE
jgi:hypothetical protein